MSKQTVCVDFDGVIHKAITPWTGDRNIPDEPVDGAIGWLTLMTDAFNVVILSSRARTHEGEVAILKWLVARGITGFEVTAIKPPAIVYIDDRGYHFDGSNWPTEEMIRNFQPWNR